MKPINYQLTNTLINNIVKLEVEKSRLEDIYTKLDDPSKAKLDQEQKRNEIFHIAHILGLDITLKDAEKFILGRIETGDNQRLAILRNYKNAVEYIRSNRNDYIADLSKELILHINKLLIFNWKEQWDAKFRIDSNIEPSFEGWLPIIDESIQSTEIEKEIEVTIGWYKGSKNKINSLIRIAVAAYRLVRISPHPNLNQLSIIGITDFLLQQNGYTNKTLVSTSKLFDNNSDEISDLWNRAAQSPTGNITFWIESFIGKLGELVVDQQVTFKLLMEKQENKPNQPFLNLNKRQLKILKYLQTIPSVKREDYVQMFDVSTMTAYRDLNELLKKRLIKIQGQGRATKYFLANR